MIGRLVDDDDDDDIAQIGGLVRVSAVLAAASRTQLHPSRLHQSSPVFARCICCCFALPWISSTNYHHYLLARCAIFALFENRFPLTGASCLAQISNLKVFQILAQCDQDIFD